MTAMTEITRSGSRSARALNSIQSRYNQIIDESSSTGKKLSAWYKEHNIEIKDQNGQLKSFYEVGVDVAKIWDTLSRNEKSYYKNIQAGANQAQNLSALFSNYKTAIDATNTALHENQSAAKENAKYQDSLEGHLNNLSSAWENFSRQLVNSDMIKGGLSVLTGFLDFLTSGVGKITAFSAAFVALNKGFEKLFVKGLNSAMLGKTFETILPKLRSVVALISPLTVGVAALGAAFAVAGKQTYDYYQSLGQYEKQVNKVIKTNQKRIDNENEAYGSSVMYMSHIQKLLDIEGKNAAQKKELAGYVEKLNDLYPDLNLQYDKNNDKITDNTGKVYDNIAALRERISALHEEARADIYIQNATDALDKKIKLEDKEYNQQLKIQELQDKIKKAHDEGDTKAEAQYIAELAGETERYGKILDSINAAQIEYTRQMNKSVMETDEYEKALGKIEDADIAESINDKVKQGLYTAPITDKEWEKLINLEGFIKTAEEEGHEVSESVYAGIQDGIYSMPDSALALENLIDFDASTQELKSQGIEISQKFIDGFQEMKPEAQSEWLELLNAMGQVESPGIKTAFSNILNDSKLTVEQKMSEIQQLIGDTFSDAELEQMGIKIDVEGADKAKKDIKETKDAQDDLEKTPNVKKHNTVETDGKDGAEEATKGQKDLQVTPNIQKRNEIITNGLVTLSSANSEQASLQKKKNKTITNTITTWVKKIFTTTNTSGGKGKGTNSGKGGHKANGTRHYAKGTSFLDAFGNAEVNEQGFEIIQSPSGLMRVANGGKRGPTLVEEGSAIYTHGQSMRMLQKAGISEGELLSGKRNGGDVGVYGVGKLEGFKKGLSQKQYNKKVKKLREEYDNKMSALDDKRAAGNWSDEKYYQEVEKLEKKYQAKFDKLATKRSNKKKIKAKGFTKSELAEYQDIIDEKVIDEIEEYIDGMVGTLADLEAVNKMIQDADENLTEDERKELMKEAVDATMDYLDDLLDDEAISTEEYLAKIDEFYAEGMLTAKEYYEYTRELQEKEAEKIQEEIEAAIEAEEERRELEHELAEAEAELQEELREAAEEAAEAYHDSVLEQLDENQSLFESQKYTYEQMLENIQKYYDEATISAEEYYDYLNQLAEAQVTREQTQADRQWDYLSQYISRQIELESEENELLEAKNDLLEAQSKKVKVYVEGQGFVYQQDNDAVKEAEENLKSYTSVWQELQDMMSEAETLTSLKNAGLLAGSDLVSLVTGTSTSDTSTWGNLISVLAANKGAYDLANELGITDPNQISTTSFAGGQMFNISNVNLPNVTNANTFIDELTNLANKAIQSSSSRT